MRRGRGPPLLPGHQRGPVPDPLLKQQSYAFNGGGNTSVSSKLADGSLTRACEALAREAFTLPLQFSQTMKRQRNSRTRRPDSSGSGHTEGSWSSKHRPSALEHPQRTSRSRSQVPGIENGRGRSSHVESKGGSRHGDVQVEVTVDRGEDDGDVFDLLAYLFGFQKDSVRNQRENAVSILASRLARSAPGGDVDKLSQELLTAVALQWRTEQLFNYRKWCKHIWTWQIKLKKVIAHDHLLAYALEVALSLLLWGEAANLRLCPEFLCWAYHKSAKQLRTVLESKNPKRILSSYLEQVIRPCYQTLADQYEESKGVDTAYIKNYDDFNETFWSRSCLGLELVGLSEERLKSKFKKTFVERQSWMAPLVSFWRVQMLLFFGLHMLITISLCTREGGCPHEDPQSYWYLPVFTIVVCYMLVDLYQIVFVLWRKMLYQCHLLTVLLSLVRAFMKMVVLIYFYVNFPGVTFYQSARLYYGLVVLLELLKFTPFLGRLQLKSGPWSLAFNILLGVDAAASYARIDRLPPLSKVFGYTMYWLCILSMKMTFNFYFMIRPLVNSTVEVWDLDVGGVYDFGFISFRDRHNIGVLVGLWMSVVFVYFIDVQVWFIVSESVLSACYGVLRHVGERLGPKEICGSFERMYRIFFRYLAMGDQQKHFRFAYVWNEVVDSMRQEDIIDDKEMSGLKYFIVSLHRPNTVLALLPGFLVSGKIQGTVTQANLYARQNDELIKDLTAVDAWGQESRQPGTTYDETPYHRLGGGTGGFEHDLEASRMGNASFIPSRQMRKLQNEQRKFLRNLLATRDPIREVACLHLFLSVFFLMEHLSQDQDICQGLWEAYDFVNNATINRQEGQSVIDMLQEANPNRVIFLLHKWPDLVVAVQKLVDAVLAGGINTVKKCMDKLCEALGEFIDPTGGHDVASKFNTLFYNLKLLQTALGSWPKSGRISTENVSSLRKYHSEFLLRLKHLITSTNRPGHVGSWEGQRRIAFFVNSMYMKQPEVGRVESMPAFSTLTPYYSEEVILSLQTLCTLTPDGVTTLEYLQTLFPQQWTALEERIKRTVPEVDFSDYARTSDASVLASMDSRAQLELQLWASYRAQTLSRTVRGMMYYDQAIRLLAVVEAEDFSEELYSNLEMGGKASPNPLYDKRGQARFVTVLHGKLKYKPISREISSTKFSYVVSCQQHSKLLRSANSADRAKAKAVELLMERHPELKVSYVDATKEGRHYSVLIRYDQGRGRIVKQYEVELPGPILLGEGKPNNQNHAIIFTRGEALQAIDMNQDGALEDALKVRQLLGEFEFNSGGNRARIVGFREFVFTHDVSSIANFFSLQELSFVTSIQRFLDKPLDVRFHYGHPDMFDKVSAMTLGGISKASKGINLSEDIFGGFNFMLRGGTATQAEYLQVGKGRDVGLGQITGFVAKISMGNGMQSRSREVYRISQQLDIFRLLSFYYSSVGFYLNQVFLILSIYLFVYAKVYLVFDSRQEDLAAINDGIARVISTQYVFQLGFLLVIPVLLVMTVENGLSKALRKFIEIMLRGSVLFFIFLAATNAHYVNLAFLTGEAKYMSTGRGFVIVHEHFLAIFRQYLQSHFVPAFEILVLIVIYWHFGNKASGFNFVAETFSIWLLVVAWLWSPMIFNPNGVEWLDVIKDFDGWISWMTAEDDDPSKSWQAWWTEQTLDLSKILRRKKFVLAVWRLRFLMLVWGFSAALQQSREDRGQEVVGIQWILLAVVAVVCTILATQGVASCRAQLSGLSSSTSGRLVGLLVSLVGVGCLVFLPLFGVVAAQEIIYFFGAVGFMLYFLVSEVGLISGVGNGDHSSSRVMVSAYRMVHFTIGLIIMVPIMVVAFFPFSAQFQTRMLFNQNFSARFTTAKLFATEREREDAKKRRGPPAPSSHTSSPSMSAKQPSARTKAI